VGIVVIVICSGIGQVTILLAGGAMVRMVGECLAGVKDRSHEKYGNRIAGNSLPAWLYLCKTILHIERDLLLMDQLVIAVEMFVLLQWRMTGLSGFPSSVLW
jgi:hypothetical protein